MPKKSTCLVVPKELGEKGKALVIALKLFDRTLGIRRDSAFLYIPLLLKPPAPMLKSIREQIGNADISTCTFTQRRQTIRSYTDILADKFPPHIFAALPRSADIVGDIAIIEITPELEPYKKDVGKALMVAHKNVKTVLAKASPISGTYRLRTFNVITGMAKTTTVHKENGCKFHVDVASAYFSPRLSYEHSRVASLVKESETVVDLFAGVGPFAVQIAWSLDNVKVFAVDVNPDAVELLRKNVRLNRVTDKVHPILGEARQIVEEELVGIADRVIMNLPERAIEFVDVACKTLKMSGGIVHFHSFMSSSNTLDMVKTKFARAVKIAGRKLEGVQASRLVRETAPCKWQVVLDARLA